MSATTTTVPVQIRVDKRTREQANALFKDLGTDMSGAVNMFLKQCVLTDGIPLRIRRSRFSRELEEAIDEAEKLASDSSAPVYHNSEELWAALEA